MSMYIPFIALFYFHRDIKGTNFLVGLSVPKPSHHRVDNRGDDGARGERGEVRRLPRNVTRFRSAALWLLYT